MMDGGVIEDQVLGLKLQARTNAETTASTLMAVAFGIISGCISFITLLV